MKLSEEIIVEDEYLDMLRVGGIYPSSLPVIGET